MQEQLAVGPVSIFPPTSASTGARPSGTVAFLFTDIEGSTRRWEERPDAMRVALARHDALVREVIEGHGGYVFKTVGDAFCAAFTTAPQALTAAVQAQRALRVEPWGEVGEIRVRMAIHMGEAEERDGDYFGPTLNRVARLLSAGHGGQILLSSAACDGVSPELPEGTSLQDMRAHRLKDLALPERIFQLLAPDLPDTFPALNTLDRRPNNLPIQPTPLVGREAEVAAIREKLLRADVALLTLLGTGGIGKTRLSLQVAAEVLDDFDDGVFFVNLSTIDDPALVIPAVAQTLGLREVGGQPLLETLREYLHDKRLLLVLDNFEQVLDEGRTVAELLKGAPRLKVLATSRAALRLSMEREHHVPPLAVPNLRRLPPVEILSEYEAVQLFRARARAVRPDFELDAGNAHAIAEICVRLDGLPLAIELAAARIKILTPQAMLTRLGNRLKLLTGGARDLPTRQQTLRGAIEWSYDLLDPEEQLLFRRLSAFVGGRTLEAVEAVCSVQGDLGLDVLDGLGSLIDKSLVYQTEGVEGAPRFMLLQTIQEYAWERLEESSEAESIQRQHAGFFLALAEAAESGLLGREQAVWLCRLEEEHDNLRAALDWLQSAAEAESALRLAGAVYRFWLVRGHLSEGRKRMAAALESSTGPDCDAASLVPVRAKVLRGAGVLACSQGDTCSARSLLEESLSLARASNDHFCVAASLNNLGNVALGEGRFDEARVLYEQSLEVRRELGDKRGIGESLGNLAVVAHEQKDYSSARALLEESLAIQRDLGEKRYVAFALNNLGDLAAYQDDCATARSYYEESLSLLRELGDPVNILAAIEGLASAMGRLEQPARAVVLLTATETLRGVFGAPLPSWDSRCAQAIAMARGRLDQAEWEAAIARGRAMTLEEAIACALAEREPEGPTVTTGR